MILADSDKNRVLIFREDSSKNAQFPTHNFRFSENFPELWFPRTPKTGANARTVTEAIATTELAKAYRLLLRSNAALVSLSAWKYFLSNLQ